MKLERVAKVIKNVLAIWGLIWLINLIWEVIK